MKTLRDYLQSNAQYYRFIADDFPESSAKRFGYLGMAHMCDKMLEELSNYALNASIHLKPEVYS